MPRGGTSFQDGFFGIGLLQRNKSLAGFVKCPLGVRDLFHFTSSKARYFTMRSIISNSAKQIFHAKQRLKSANFRTSQPLHFFVICGLRQTKQLCKQLLSFYRIKLRYAFKNEDVSFFEKALSATVILINIVYILITSAGERNKYRAELLLLRISYCKGKSV